MVCNYTVNRIYMVTAHLQSMTFSPQNLVLYLQMQVIQTQAPLVLQAVNPVLDHEMEDLITKGPGALTLTTNGSIFKFILKQLNT